MARNKDRDKSLSEKLKSFLGFKESTPLNFNHLKFEPHHISPDIIKEIGPTNLLQNRLRILKELGETVMTKRIEDHVIENLFKSTRDMATSDYSMETRHTILQFYSCVIEAQLEKMTVMRAVFFQLILKHNIPEDASVRLELLKTLSENGKNIHNFEEDIGPFLLRWFPEILSSGPAVDFLPIVINMIKHNAAYLDDKIISGYLECVCAHCGKTSAEGDLKLCLDVMDAVLCYSHLPSNALHNFIFALCLTVNIVKFSQISWKLMRDLLGTSLGHKTIYSLCLFLQDKRNQRVPEALRGSVFFIGMALWGSKKVETLPHPPSTVLPSFYMALDYNSNSVALEVALSVERLVKKNGKLMPIYDWNVILDIVEQLLKYPDLQSHQQPIYQLATCVHDLITAIENCNSSYCNERLYNIIEHCSSQRDESSVIRLIKYHGENIHPIREDFIPNIKHLLEKYFKNEKRPNVQMAVVNIVKAIRVCSGLYSEDDVMDQTILCYMCHLDAVPDVTVRKAVIELLLEMAEMCVTKRYFDILEILEKVMKSHFEKLPGKKTCADVEAAVSGLITIFEKKLYTLPSSHCVKVYNILVNHVMLQYRHILYTEGDTRIRRMIISFFLKIRTNFKKQVGILVDGRVSYSVYVLCETPEVPSDASYVPSSPSPGSPAVFTLIPLTHCFKEMFQALIGSLKMEKDWIILELLFQELPKLLQNKALVICGNCNLTMLCVALCALVNERSFGYPENLHNAPERMTFTDFQSQIYPVIASLAAYHNELETRMQGMLIRCLQSGLVSRSAKVCIEGLTLCTLEMRDMMVKYMPSVLSKLSKISATVTVSVAVLEFLSNLIRLPPLYMSFVEDQYRSIFAIALPYTNPYKFNQYTVALAHHVIAMWFLKCRIPFRKEFSKYIAKGLRSNMSLPMDDERISTSTRSETSDKSKINTSDEATLTLHTELLEIGLDLMARFTFGMSSNAPKRSAVADFLLEKGQKASWLIGNKIITITTSGCGTKSFKYGLCEKCYSCCREICDSMSSDDSESALPTTPEPPMELPTEGRRRHKSAFHRTNTTLMENTKLTKDDILLHRQKPRIRHNFRRNTSCTATVPETSCPPVSVPDPTEDVGALDDNKSNTYQLCSCWCSGWAEVYTRQPTGNSSWMMRIQNQLFLPTSSPNIVLPAISSLLLPNKAKTKEEVPSTKEGSDTELQSTCANDKDEASGSEAAAEDSEEVVSSATSDALNCPKSKVPLRRTNSSPDMNSGFMSYSRQSAVKKSALRSQVTKEEQTPFENGNNGEIFHFEDKDDDRQEMEVVTPKSRVRIRTHPDYLPKTTFRDPPKMGQPNALEKGLESANLPNAFRDRGHTISVMSPNRAGTSGGAQLSKRNKDMHRSGMNPNFVFLQLYHNSFLSSSFKPLVLRQTEQNVRSLSVIDHIHPYDTHKIGVIFVGPEQMDNEQVILSNLSGSNRYSHFLRRLGNLICLSTVDQELTYVGGLDLKGFDGKYALVWHDDVMRVAFHVATLMPNRDDDPKRNNKKTHIGNNFVTIVYNESNEDYIIGTIKSQFTRACVIIHPEDYNSNVVTIKTKNKDLSDIFGHTDAAYIVSDESLPIFVRQMALHANLASLILDPRQQFAHVSNWLARLRAIKRLRAKLTEEVKLNSDGSKSDCKSNFFIDDFTDYV